LSLSLWSFIICEKSSSGPTGGCGIGAFGHIGTLGRTAEACRWRGASGARRSGVVRPVRRARRALRSEGQGDRRVPGRGRQGWPDHVSRVRWGGGVGE
jgi:hypothetical protein